MVARKKRRVVIARRCCYNKHYTDGQAPGLKEEFTVPYIMEKIYNIKLSPETRRKLGLERNWSKKVSPKQVARVVKTAEKYKAALRELSKY